MNCARPEEESMMAAVTQDPELGAFQGGDVGVFAESDDYRWTVVKAGTRATSTPLSTTCAVRALRSSRRTLQGSRRC